MSSFSVDRAEYIIYAYGICIDMLGGRNEEASFNIYSCGWVGRGRDWFCVSCWKEEKRENEEGEIGHRHSH